MNRTQRILKRFREHGIEDCWIEYPFGSVTRASDLDVIDAINERTRYDEGTVIAILPYTVSGDYVGSRVETSNCQLLVETYGIVRTRHEAYGSAMAVVDVVELVDSLSTIHDDHGIWDDLKSLQSYPVLDEQLMAELEMEDMLEAWDSWAQSDLMREIWNLVYRGDDSDDWAKDWQDLHPIELGELDGAPWDFGHAEGCSWWFDVERIARHVVDTMPQLVRWTNGAELGGV